MAAKKKEPDYLESVDIKADRSQIGASGSHNKILKLFQPVREDRYEIVKVRLHRNNELISPETNGS